MADHPVTLSGEDLSLAALAEIARARRGALLDEAGRGRIRAARGVVLDALREGRRVYGVTTGFGLLSDVAIPAAQANALQTNLVRSHAAGVGDPLPRDVVRAMIALKLNTIARGTSGVREEIADALLGLLRADVIPRVPSQGSVGASGDLAPLAHMALVLIGEGEVLTETGRGETAAALADAGLARVALEPIEGLALINGTQAMTAVAALAVGDAARLLGTAQVAAALSLDALRGSVTPFRREFRTARSHPGIACVAANMTRLLAGSAVNASHKDCPKIQDAYSLRATAAVLGPCVEWHAHASEVVRREMNSDTGNPLVFAETSEILSGGNFHGEPVAIASDTLAIALTEVASLSERRINRLVDPHLSELPAFLARDPGLESGMMIPQYTAAALVSESKVLAHPASVDSIPTSADKEDHVSMGMTAALKLGRILDNALLVVAIELVAAAQALEFLRPLATTEALEAAHAAVRAESPRLDADRSLSAEIEAVARLVRDGTILRAVERAAGPLERPGAAA